MSRSSGGPFGIRTPLDDLDDLAAADDALGGPVEPCCLSCGLAASDGHVLGCSEDPEAPAVSDAAFAFAVREALLSGALDEALGGADGLARVSSFEEAEVLTNDQGAVVRLASGAEFQLAIVRSR